MSTRVPAAQYSTNAGIFSPRLYGRTDIPKYKNALEDAINVICLPHGPAIKRNGSKYISDVKTHADNTRLIRFQKSNSDAFILEFGDLYVRFYENGAQLSGPLEVVTPYTEAQVFDLEVAQFGDDLYIVHSAHEPRRLRRNSSTSWLIETLDIDPPPTIENGEFPVATLTPGATTGSGINFTASAASFLANDIGRQLVYRDSTTDELLGVAVITAFTSTTVVVCEITVDFPSTSAIASGGWKIDLSPNATLTPSGKDLGAIVTLTSVANIWKDDAQVSHVGRYVHIQNGVIRIDTVTSALVCEGEVVKELEAVTATDTWTLEESAISATRGWPNSIGFFEERMWFGGTTEQPQNLWASVSNEFTNFGKGANDSDALDLLISDSIASPISWISSGRDLIVGGSGGEFTVSSSGGFITPSDRSIRLRSTYGSNIQNTHRMGNETLFVEASGTRIRAIRYDFDQDNYDSEDLLFLADHLTKGGSSGIKELAIAQSPNNLIYAVLDDGSMLVGSFNRKQEVISWQKFETAGKYKSVATITEGDHDEVWVVVERLINGSSVQYVERFDEFDDNDGLSASDGFSDSYIMFGTAFTVSSITVANPPVVATSGAHGFIDGDTVIFYDAMYTDSNGILQSMTDINKKTYTVANKTATTFELSGIDGTAFQTYTNSGNVYKKVTSITGLTHLEGRTVSVKQDNGAAADRTVSSGAITLTAASGLTQIGLPYTMSLKTLRPSGTEGAGFEGQHVRYVRPVLRLFQSKLPVVNGQSVPIRDSAMPMGIAPDLFSGDVEYRQTDWKDLGQITITDTSPFPIMINAIFGTIEIGAR